MMQLYVYGLDGGYLGLLDARVHTEWGCFRNAYIQPDGKCGSKLMRDSRVLPTPPVDGRLPEAQ